METPVGAADWAWWLGLLAGAVPLLALAVWHCTDAFHCAVFAINHLGHSGQRPRLTVGHMVGEALALL
ncbi:hypothetical protein E2562_003247 [Oryza meyeriana var. granulata]|uniref:Uncharacterized protein n=1 Tax=Oryza meyeriana var. granulata TaxID=110450 RepID=A0A6G1EV02_9ORYZ|nr:hypothetical protein E2562_003247 [Oryza meyeriana var. granulata]